MVQVQIQSSAFGYIDYVPTSDSFPFQAMDCLNCMLVKLIFLHQAFIVHLILLFYSSIHAISGKKIIASGKDQLCDIKGNFLVGQLFAIKYPDSISLVNLNDSSHPLFALCIFFSPKSYFHNSTCLLSEAVMN